MVFSGMVSHYRCSGCDFKGSQAHSTSLMFYTALIGLAAAFIIPRAMRLADLHWHHFLGILLGEIILLLLAAFLSYKIANVIDGVPKECPSCGGKIVEHGSGFYDFSIVPHISDIFIGIIFIGLNVVAFYFVKDLFHG
jgi:hypothetical protein